MRWLRTLYFLNGLSFGAFFGFLSVLLQAKGFEPALIGVTTSLGSLAYTFALPVWGHLGDIVSGPRRTLQIACIPAAVFAIGLSAPLPVLAIIVCQVILSAGGGPTAALTDAMAVPVLKNATKEYSRLRLITSIGGAGGSVACGFIFSVVGYMAAPVFYVGIMVAMIVCAQFVSQGRDSERGRRASAVRDGRVHVETERGRFGSVGEAFAVRPRLALMLVSVGFVFIGIMAANTYMTLRISDLGGGPIEVGFANGIGSTAEIPGLILASILVAKLGARRVLAVSSFGFAACLFSWVVLVDAVPILTTRFLSGIFFSGILVSYVLTFSRMLPFKLQSTGQTLFQAAAFGVAAILANLLGGILYAGAGPLGVFGGGALCAIIGGVVGLAAIPGFGEASGGVRSEPAALPGAIPANF